MMNGLIAALVLMLSVPAFADPVGYPGSAWGVLSTPSSVISGTPEDDNWLYQGRITQGIDWFYFGGEKNWLFDTYGAFGISKDRNGLDYNNKLVPALGAKITRGFDNGVVDIGVEAIYEKHFGSLDGGGNVRQGPRWSDSGVQMYVSYWFGWNAKK